MRNRKVVLVAYQEQENLGVGYLSSMLESRGYQVHGADFGLSNERICNSVREADPLVVGFSLIFQYHLPRLQDLTSSMRKSGISAHFTVGGHYPSLRYKDVLDVVPELDSVVRFEGEYTLCQLVDYLSEGADWKSITGIAYRKASKPVSNELRPLVPDLDTLPYPKRDRKRQYKCMSLNCSFLLASRGCVRNCSFCSVRSFYGTPPGKLKRYRSPANVVQEMLMLYNDCSTRVFLFQDDDFLTSGPLGERWVASFISELEKADLAGKVFLKISCRCDEVAPDLFYDLKHAGLGMVYLGIESGTRTGLLTLKKHLTVEDNRKAAATLKQLDLLYEFGFMLFDPSSTFQSIRENVSFLRHICGDGSAPAVFCKMVPYAETDIEKSLMDEGRLKGSVTKPDYSFTDHKLDQLYEFLYRALHQHMFNPRGLLAKLRWNRFEMAVSKMLDPIAEHTEQVKGDLRSITSMFNEVFFRIVNQAATHFQHGGLDDDFEMTRLVSSTNADFRKIESMRRELMTKVKKRL